MESTPTIKNLYAEIQQKLFYMIPEKWDKLYLYASVFEKSGKQTGEMFFYYFPKGIIKKNPVNVYEVPSRFNIDENAYMKLADEVYELIKKLKQQYKLNELEPWSNITISVENFKFKVECNNDDLVNSAYTSYDRHIIWRYKYLKTPLSMYNKKDRKTIETYLNQNNEKEKELFEEAMYKKPVNNTIEYDRNTEKVEEYVKEDKKVQMPKNTNKDEEQKSQILDNNK